MDIHKVSVCTYEMIAYESYITVRHLCETFPKRKRIVHCSVFIKQSRGNIAPFFGLNDFCYFFFFVRTRKKYV